MHRFRLGVQNSFLYSLWWLESSVNVPNWHPFLQWSTYQVVYHCIPSTFCYSSLQSFSSSLHILPDMSISYWGIAYICVKTQRSLAGHDLFLSFSILCCGFLPHRYVPIMYLWSVVWWLGRIWSLFQNPHDLSLSFAIFVPSYLYRFHFLILGGSEPRKSWDPQVWVFRRWGVQPPWRRGWMMATPWNLERTKVYPHIWINCTYLKIGKK